MSTIKRFKIRKIYFVILAVYMAAVIFTMNDAWLYSVPVAKITDIKTKVSGQLEGTGKTKENQYKQEIEAVLLNGKEKGKNIKLSNEYTYTGALGQAFHEGDKVLLNGTVNNIGKGIRSLKRDTILVSLIGFILFLVWFLGGKKGIYTILSLCVNTIVFGIAFWKFSDISDILPFCNILVTFFTVATLVLLNGINRNTIAAILTTLCVLACIMGLWDFLLKYVQEPDYSTIEYMGLRSIDNPEEIFKAEILFSGLGAIMDIAVAVSAALEELAQKKKELSFSILFRSGREIGYDIMGTMINVLMCVFICGLIPMCIIRLNNNVSMMTIITQHISCEIYRFFIESIGIVITIPISVFISSVVIMKQKKRC